MAWEKRQRGGLYYTRSRRVGRRVVREYLGTGPLAEALARQDAEARARRRERTAAERRAREADAALEGLVDELGVGVDTLTQATLVLAGYHRHHRGDWRRRRQRHDHDEGADQGADEPGGLGAGPHDAGE